MPLINKCMFYGSMYYCEATKPVYRTNTLHVCEWQLYTNSTTTNCEYTEIIEKEDWIQVNEKIWLFRILENTNVSVICNNQKTKLTLNNAGIMKLEPDCHITSNSVYIKTPKIIKTETEAIKLQMHSIRGPRLHTDASID